ncbi:hypothetical protein [Agrobacterium sp. CG674]
MTETAPANLQDYILAEVTRKTSEEHIRTLIDKKIDEAIKGAVDDEFRYGGNLKEQLTTAVSDALSIGDKIDVPAYGCHGHGAASRKARCEHFRVVERKA